MRIGAWWWRIAVVACVLGGAVALAQQGGGEREGRAWLGVSIRDPDTEAGPVVTAVDADGPAAAAGLAPGDVVLRVDGATVTDRRGFIDRLRDRRPGDRVRLDLRGRDGVERSASVLLSERGFDPERLVERLQGSWSGGLWPGRPRLGVDVADVDADLGRYFSAPRRDCVLVTRVHPDGPSERAGVRAGDLILGLDSHDVRGVDGLQTLLAERADADSVRLELWRRDRRMSVQVLLGQGAAWLRRPLRSEPSSTAELEEMRRELRSLRRELDDLRREVDLLRRRR